MSDPESEILFVVSKYFEFGGMQRTMLRVAKRLVSLGHKVTVLACRWEGEPVDGIEVITKPSRALSNEGRNIELAEQLKTLKQQRHFDCVVGFIKIPGLDIYYAGDPCYAETISGRSRLVKLLPRYRRYLELEQSVFGRGKDTEILLIAHQQLDNFRKYYDTELERFHLLPPGINRERILGQRPMHEALQKLRTELNIWDDQKILLNVGSGFRTKGIDRIIRGLSSLPPNLRESTRLVVVGEDKPDSFLELAKKLKIEQQVIFTGGRSDVVDFYHIADALVHPAYSENTGTTLVEAMLCGLPVLATENCGFSYHVRRADAGLITPEPFEQQKFNRQLQEILTSEARHDWQRNGPWYCDKTDLYSLIDKAADIIARRATRDQAGIADAEAPA